MATLLDNLYYGRYDIVEEIGCPPEYAACADAVNHYYAKVQEVMGPEFFDAMYDAIMAEETIQCQTIFRAGVRFGGQLTLEMLGR